MIPVASLMRSLETGLPAQYNDDTVAQAAFNQRFPGGVWQHCPVFITHADGRAKFGAGPAPPPDTATYLRNCRCEYHTSLRTLLDATPRRAKPGPRIYTRIVNTCGQCHCINRGTQFRPTLCSRTGQEVQEFAPPPESCPLPLA